MVPYDLCHMDEETMRTTGDRRQKKARRHKEGWERVYFVYKGMSSLLTGMWWMVCVTFNDIVISLETFSSFWFFPSHPMKFILFLYYRILEENCHHQLYKLLMKSLRLNCSTACAK